MVEKISMTATAIELEKCCFYYGKGMQNNWMESNRVFMDYIGCTFGQSVKASLIAGELVVTEVDESLLPKFVTAEAEKDYLSELKHWEKELYKQAKDDFRKFSWDIRRDLSFVYGILYSLCHVSLRNKLEVDSGYQKMVSTKRFNAIVLYQRMRKICNGSTSVVGEDVLGNLMESLYNFLLIKGDDHESLWHYRETLAHRYSILKESGFDLATDNLRDECMDELLSRGRSESMLYKRLLGWKKASADGSDATDINLGKEALMEAFGARIYMKRAGRKCDEFRRYVHNGYVMGSREYPSGITEASLQMEHYRPVQIIKETKRGRKIASEVLKGEYRGRFIPASKGRDVSCDIGTSASVDKPHLASNTNGREGDDSYTEVSV